MTGPDPARNADIACIACTAVAVARVIDGTFRKPVCAAHRRLYSERGYLIDALPGYRIPPEGDLRARLAEAEADRDRALARESDLKAVRDGLLERLEAVERVTEGGDW